MTPAALLMLAMVNLSQRGGSRKLIGSGGGQVLRYSSQTGNDSVDMSSNIDNLAVECRLERMRSGVEYIFFLVRDAKEIDGGIRVAHCVIQLPSRVLRGFWVDERYRGHGIANILLDKVIAEYPGFSLIVDLPKSTLTAHQLISWLEKKNVAILKRVGTELTFMHEPED